MTFCNSALTPTPKAARFFRVPVVPEVTVPMFASAEVKCQLHCDDDKLTHAFSDDSSGGFNLFGEDHRFFLLILTVHILLVSTSPGIISYSNTLTIRILEDLPG